MLQSQYTTVLKWSTLCASILVTDLVAGVEGVRRYAIFAATCVGRLHLVNWTWTAVCADDCSKETTKEHSKKVYANKCSWFVARTSSPHSPAEGVSGMHCLGWRVALSSGQGRQPVARGAWACSMHRGKPSTRDTGCGTSAC